MIILSVDLGDKRTGIAICDKMEILASPYTTITEENRDKLAEIILETAKKLSAEKIVIGLPLNMDGSQGESAIKAKQFRDKLQSNTELKIDMIDERCTTLLAHNYLNDTNTRGKKRKQMVDSISAVVILEDYIKKQRRDSHE